MMNGRTGLIADFVATFNSVRLSPQGHYVRSRLTSTFCGSLFDILRFSSDLCLRVSGYNAESRATAARADQASHAVG